MFYLLVSTGFLQGLNNMSKDLVSFKETTDITIPKNWDYDSSVQRQKNLFKAVREQGGKALVELRKAHQILTEDANKKKGRKYPNKTFETYCEDIEIGRRTGYRWIEKYFPIYYLDVRQKALVSDDTTPLPPNIDIWQGDFRELADKIEDESIDLILTDPPYAEEYLGLWQDLFVFASKKLKPSSFLVAYSGLMYLDKIFKMKNELIYYWMMNIEFTKKPLVMGRNMINGWKSILVFQKPPFKKLKKVVVDKIKLDYTERELHDKNWGQTVQPFEFLLESFSKINDKVVDPMAGTGTTLIACRNKSRSCLGIETEEKYIDLVKGRIKIKNR